MEWTVKQSYLAEQSLQKAWSPDRPNCFWRSGAQKAGTEGEEPQPLRLLAAGPLAPRVRLDRRAEPRSPYPSMKRLTMRVSSRPRGVHAEAHAALKPVSPPSDVQYWVPRLGRTACAGTIALKLLVPR